MYAALFRMLPGPVWLRVLILVVLAAALVTALVVWVFPLIDQLTTDQEVTVRQ